MQEKDLNELYSQWATGLIEKRDFEGLVYQYFTKNQGKTSVSHWDTEKYEDFISWFYHRLHRAIERYNKKKGAFHSFINRVLRISAKEYNMRITINSITEYSAWSVQIPDMYTHEEAPVYKTDNKMDLITDFILDRRGRKNPRQLLALILKCYYHVSDDFLERISPKIEIESNKLKEMINKLRAIRQLKDDELYLMKERIHCQYYRCIVYERRLTLLQENTPIYNNLKIKQEKARKRLDKMRRRIAAIRTDATNREIADVIGISKGSVDSQIHRLKLKMNIMSDKTILN